MRDRECSRGKERDRASERIKNEDIDESLTETSIDNLSSVVIDSDEILTILRECV